MLSYSWSSFQINEWDLMFITSYHFEMNPLTCLFFHWYPETQPRHGNMTWETIVDPLPCLYLDLHYELSFLVAFTICLGTISSKCME